MPDRIRMSNQEQPQLPFFQMKNECSAAEDSSHSFEQVVKDVSNEEESSVCTTSTSASSHCEGDDDIRIHNVSQQIKAKVSFCPVVVKVEYHSQYEDIWTEEQVRQLLWYTSEDLEEIRRENAETVFRMKNGSIGLYSGQYCSRGLEARTPAGAQRRLKHRQESLEAVLEYKKKAEHAMTAIDSSVQHLAEKYAQKTHGSIRIAQLMATIDAKLVSSEAGRNITTSAFKTKHLSLDTNLAVYVQ